MPELIEVERYGEAALAVLGRRISGVFVLDPRVVTGSATSLDELCGYRVSGVRRRGKRAESWPATVIR